MVDKNKVVEALKGVKHPKLNKAFIDLGMIRDLVVDGGTVSMCLALKSERSPLRPRLQRQIEQAVLALPEVEKVQISVTTLSNEQLKHIFPTVVLRGIARVKQIIAVASGKGGVGKTTVAVNFALTLAGRGYRVGLMDADIYGPSIPVMLDLAMEPESQGDIVTPVEKFGIKIMSLGMAVKEDEPFIWRGPLVSKMIHNLLDKVNWGELDYLVVDLPPGTGDPSITIANAIPDCRILMITTPQKVSLADVQRAIGLFRKYGREIIGLVENMSYFSQGPDGERLELFGSGGGEMLSRENMLPLLGAIPLDLAVRKSEDASLPLMVAEPDSAAAAVFRQIAGKIDLLPK